MKRSILIASLLIIILTCSAVLGNEQTIVEAPFHITKEIELTKGVAWIGSPDPEDHVLETYFILYPSSEIVERIGDAEITYTTEANIHFTIFKDQSETTDTYQQQLAKFLPNFGKEAYIIRTRDQRSLTINKVDGALTIKELIRKDEPIRHVIIRRLPKQEITYQRWRVTNEKEGIITVVKDGKETPYNVPFTTEEGTQVTFKEGEVFLRGDPTNLPLISYGKEENGRVTSRYISYENTGKYIAQNAVDTLYAHFNAIEDTGIGTHYGSASWYSIELAEGASPPVALIESEFEEKLWTSGQPHGQYHAEAVRVGSQLTLQQAAFYTHLRTQIEMPKELTAREQEERRRAIDAGTYVEPKIVPLYTEAEALQKTLNRGLIGADIPLPRRASCVGISQELLRSALKQVGKPAENKKILQTIKKTEARGISIAKTLEDMGWTIIFVTLNEKNLIGYGRSWYNKVKQGLPYPPEYYLVKGGPSYPGVKPKYILRNFGEGAEQTVKEQEAFTTFAQDPQVTGGLIVADAGTHVTLLIRDPEDQQLKVFENHYGHNPVDKKVFEMRPIENWPWSNYIVALPPGTDLSYLEALPESPKHDHRRY